MTKAIIIVNEIKMNGSNRKHYSGDINESVPAELPPYTKIYTYSYIELNGQRRSNRRKSYDR